MKAHIFIDGANVFHSTQDIDRDYRIDYNRLAHYLTRGDELIRTHFYMGVPHNISNDEKRFLNTLNHLPHFEVKTKELIESHGQVIEKGIDVQIAADMLWTGFEHKAEHIILVSGDQDILPAVTRLKDNGIQITVAAFHDSASYKLIQAADTFIDLAKHIDEVELRRLK